MSTFDPTDEQRLALETRLPLLVLAGAGTGKTTVLTRRIAATILAGAARPDEILALTFTDKAANEMAERLVTVLGEMGRADDARAVTALTFHAFGARVVGENLLALGFDRPPAVQPTAGAWQLLASLFDDLTFDTIEVAGSIGDTFRRLLAFFGEARDNLVGPDEVGRYAAGIAADGLPPAAAEFLARKRGEARDLAAAYRAFGDARRARGLVSFGDLLDLPVRLFRERPDVRDSYRRRYRHVFVDEYQDTNSAQRQLLMELLDPAAPNVMVIGDDDQSIYRWRGAVVQNILGFPKEPHLTGRVERLPLTENRRSIRPILDLANRAISNIDPANRFPKELACHPANADLPGTVARFEAATGDEEADAIAATIAARLEWARRLAGPKRGYGAFVVLCRKRTLFEPVCAALDRAKIPYELVGGAGFYGRWEVRDLLSYLRVLARPSDDLALARVLLSRRVRLAGRDMYHLAAWVRRANGPSGRGADDRPSEAKQHLLDAVLAAGPTPPALPSLRGKGGVAGLSADARNRLGGLAADLSDFDRARRRLPLAELVSLAIERTGYRDELRARNDYDSRVALLNLEKLESLARDFATGDPQASLADYVELVRYSLDSGEDESQVRPVDETTDTVKVMTVHQAKGLEFPVVFVPGLSDGVFPPKGRDESDRWERLPWELRADREHRPRLDLSVVRTEKDLKAARDARKVAEIAQQLDEERRLFYVAVTRAERELYLSRADRYGSEKKPRAGSEFWEVAGAGPNPPAPFPAGEGGAADAVPLSPAGRGGGGEGWDSPQQALLLSDAEFAAWLDRETAIDPARWSALKAAVDAHVESVLATPLVAPAVAGRPAVSVSALCLYLACPRHYRYLYVDRLPTRPSPAATLGDEVHRLIEEESRRTALTTLADEPTAGVDPEAGDDPSDAARAVRDERLLDVAADETVFAARAEADADAGRGDSAPDAAPESGPRAFDLAALLAAYRQSEFGRRPATFVELSFELLLENGTLRGRIDRLDRLAVASGGERWSVVDYKSGGHSAEAAAHYRRQLALYALAVEQDFGASASSITAHLLFLRDGVDFHRAFTVADLAAARAEAEAALAAVARGEYACREERAGCGWCEYAGLCFKS